MSAISRVPERDRIFGQELLVQDFEIGVESGFVDNELFVRGHLAGDEDGIIISAVFLAAGLVLAKDLGEVIEELLVILGAGTWEMLV
jgi:hypothetical protein